MADREIPLVAITEEHRTEFRRAAPAEIARRSPAWFAEQAWAPLEPALTAIVSLAGLWLFGWPALVVLGFSLACYWNAVLCDAAKLLLARSAVLRDAAEYNRTTSFWLVAEAIRSGKREMPAHYVAQYKPGQGLLADVLLGLVATGIIVGKVVDEAIRAGASALPGSTTWIALGVTLGLQWLATLAVVVRHHRPGPRAPMRFSAGARGFGLFALAVLGLVLQDKAGATVFAVALNLALLALAAVMAWGTWLLRDETTWLRAELAAHSVPDGRRTTATGDVDSV